jgi:hypothetical protein
MAGNYFRQALVHVLLRNIYCRSIFTCCVFVGPCYSFHLRAVIDGRSLRAPKYFTSQYATPTSPPPGASSYLYKSHGLSVRSTSIHPNYTLVCTTMDAIRALLINTCSPMAVAEPEAQPQQDCARSTIPAPHPILTPYLNRGTVLSRHDDPPLGTSRRYATGIHVPMMHHQGHGIP